MRLVNQPSKGRIPSDTSGLPKRDLVHRPLLDARQGLDTKIQNTLIKTRPKHVSLKIHGGIGRSFAGGASGFAKTVFAGMW